MDSPREVDSGPQQRLRQQEVVADLGQRALETDDLDQLLSSASTAVVETLDADYATVLELLPDGSELLLRHGDGWQDGIIGSATVSPDPDSQVGYTLRSDRPIIVDDLHVEDRFSGLPLLTDHGVTSGISVVIGSLDGPWGVLGVYSRERRTFAAYDGNFVQSVANLLAAAVENYRTRRELDEVYERITSGFHAFDNEWKFIHVNERAEEILGVDREELLGTTLWEAFPDLVGTEFEARYREAKERREPITFEAYYSPHEIWYEEHVYPSETGVSVYFRDVTARKEYERKLEKSNERLEQFAYAASHDLQEPLRMVSTYLQLIQSRYGDTLDEEGEEFLEFAVDGADRMRKMIEGLLEYSRIEREGDPTELVDLNEVLDDVRESLSVKIIETDAEVSRQPLPHVRGDETQLYQLFQNLLGNAIEYSGDDPPQIQVTATRNGQNVVVSVHDDGVGISAVDQDRIFQVFERLHSREEYSGAGIGLALCQRIVEQHEGEIWVDSEPGDGSTFSFTLPAA